MKLSFRQKHPTLGAVVARINHEINRKALSEVRTMARSIERSFESSVKTFNENKPEFYRKEDIGSKKIVITIGTDNKIYSFLNFGTKIRWAVMTDNFEAKTSPGRLVARVGRGRARLRGRRAMMRLGIPPKPGIEARRFDKQIIRNRFGKPGWGRELAGRIVNKL